MKPKKKIASPTTDDLLSDFRMARRKEEAARAEREEAQANLTDHLVEEYGHGVQVLSMVYTVTCWVRKCFTSAGVRRIKAKEFDRLVIRDSTLDERDLVAEAWKKEQSLGR